MFSSCLWAIVNLVWLHALAICFYSKQNWMHISEVQTNNSSGFLFFLCFDLWRNFIPHAHLTNASTIQKCHSLTRCHPHFKQSWARKQLKQFSSTKLLPLIAMKDTFSCHFPRSLPLSLSLNRKIGISSAWALRKRVIITSFSMLAVGKDFTPHNY